MSDAAAQPAVETAAAPRQALSSVDAPIEHVDVLIVGAGLSGIGAACHLREHCPQKSFAILEAREATGGTWDLFRYPGIRSDSDMLTLGYSFRPWEQSSLLADGGSILDYIRDTARIHGVDDHVRLGHRAMRAEWSSETQRWTVHAVRASDGETVALTCDFLYSCTGYYRYDEGHTPEFPGRERFAGRFVHPQHWPEDLDVEGRRVVVIGSGATAVTLVPALVARGAHATMLQRSPSYVLSIPGRDAVTEWLRRRLPPKRAHALARYKNVLIASLLYQLARRAPKTMRKLLIAQTRRQLPAGYDVQTHFNPRYDPWDQRLCFVPDGDLFAAIGAGDADVVTGEIETLTEHGVQLRDGRELPADVVVAATGLNLLVLGGMQLSVDGRDVELPTTVAYKGMMFCGVPNMALTLGYTNSSWTLKADLVARYVCRTLNHMDAIGAGACTPLAPPASLPTEPIIDLQSGYVLRSLHEMPRQGQSAPWRLHQNYARDVRLLGYGPLDDEVQFTPRRRTVDRDEASPNGDRASAASAPAPESTPAPAREAVQA